MSAYVGRAKSALTPGCENLGKTVKTSSLMIIVVVLIALLLLSATMFMHYYGKGKMDKWINGLSIAHAVFMTIALLTSIWDNRIVAKTVKQCLSTD